MTKHVKTYLNYFDIGIEDVWMCEYCGKSRPINNGLEIHHIKFRSKGGTDDISNLMCLCHDCHDRVHNHGLKIGLDDSKMKRSGANKPEPMSWKDLIDQEDYINDPDDITCHLTIDELITLCRDFMVDCHDGYVSNDRSYIENKLHGKSQTK